MTTKILVVEDSKQLTRLICDYLGMLGYEVRETSRGAEALALLDQGGFSLAIVDGVLGGPMNGLGLIREIRDRYPDLPLIGISGHPDLLPKMEKAGIAVLPKPFSVNALDRELKRVLGLL